MINLFLKELFSELDITINSCPSSNFRVYLPRTNFLLDELFMLFKWMHRNTGGNVFLLSLFRAAKLNWKISVRLIGIWHCLKPSLWKYLLEKLNILGITILYVLQMQRNKDLVYGDRNGKLYIQTLHFGLLPWEQESFIKSTGNIIE